MTETPTVVILCGGHGRRLRPLTDTLPKPMVEFHGRPMLDHIVDLFLTHNFEKFVFCTGYRGDVIKEHYSGKDVPYTTAFSEAGEDASMLERIYQARDQVGDLFLVAYGDTFVDLDLESLLAYHREQKGLATLVTTKVQNPFGLISTDQDGRVTSFREKPVFQYFIGCFIIEKAALDLVTPALRQQHDGTGLVNFFQKMIDSGNLNAYEHKGLQLTFNTETEKQRVEEELGFFYTLLEN